MNTRFEPGLQDMVKQNVHVWINGQIFPVTEAKISVFDRNVFYGDAVFETLHLTKARKVFKLQEHFRRLRVSAKALDIKVPLSDEELTKAIADCVRASGGGVVDGWIRVSISRGVAPSGLDPRHAIGEPTVIVAAFPFGPHARPSGQGVRAKIVSTRRIPPQCLDPKIKQANYLNEIFAKQEAINSGMDEALMLDVDGFLAEAPAANIFLVKDESLYTPPLKYILAGITRQTVLEIARDEQIPALEVELTVADLFSADEAILTGTGAGLAALIEVDKRPIGNGLPGPMLQKLKVLYERKVDEDSTPLF